MPSDDTASRSPRGRSGAPVSGTHQARAISKVQAARKKCRGAHGNWISDSESAQGEGDAGLGPLSGGSSENPNIG